VSFESFSEKVHLTPFISRSLGSSMKSSILDSVIVFSKSIKFLQLDMGLLTHYRINHVSASVYYIELMPVCDVPK